MKKENPPDRMTLSRIRETAIAYFKEKLPERGESPDAFVARCWYEAFLSHGYIVK